MSESTHLSQENFDLTNGLRQHKMSVTKRRQSACRTGAVYSQVEGLLAQNTESSSVLRSAASAHFPTPPSRLSFTAAIGTATSTL